MLELWEFYDSCRSLGVDIIPFVPCPAPGATMRDGEDYAIFLDFSKIGGIRAMKGVCFHELGHAATGALHKVNSPFETVARSEYRANSYLARRFLTRERLRQAYNDGCRELWQLSEYFDIPEADLQKALDYWASQETMDN